MGIILSAGSLAPVAPTGNDADTGKEGYPKTLQRRDNAMRIGRANPHRRVPRTVVRSRRRTFVLVCMFTRRRESRNAPSPDLWMTFVW